jgi:Flp pilus assembly protein TadD
LAPHTSSLYRGRAATLIHARKIEEAEQDLAHAIDLDGNEDSPYHWYYQAKIAIARGDALVANQMLDEVLKRNAFVDLAFLRAQTAWIQGDLQTAKDVFRDVWEKANLGERMAIHREMEQLFAEHPEIAGRDMLYTLMRKVDE